MKLLIDKALSQARTPGFFGVESRVSPVEGRLNLSRGGPGLTMGEQI
jgi:hypothetical protein